MEIAPGIFCYAWRHFKYIRDTMVTGHVTSCHLIYQGRELINNIKMKTTGQHKEITL